MTSSPEVPKDLLPYFEEYAILDVTNNHSDAYMFQMNLNHARKVRFITLYSHGFIQDDVTLRLLLDVCTDYNPANIRDTIQGIRTAIAVHGQPLFKLDTSMTPFARRVRINQYMRAYSVPHE
jgi:hypothetical protein